MYSVVNGDAFYFHDRTADGDVEKVIALDEFPSPEELWEKFKKYKGLTEEAERITKQDYFKDNSGKSPRYYLEKK